MTDETPDVDPPGGHEKHLQLGVSLDDMDEDPIPVDDDEDAVESIWSDATTVEQYEADIKTLAEHGVGPEGL